MHDRRDRGGWGLVIWEGWGMMWLWNRIYLVLVIFSRRRRCRFVLIALCCDRNSKVQSINTHISNAGVDFPFSLSSFTRLPVYHVFHIIFSIFPLASSTTISKHTSSLWWPSTMAICCCRSKIVSFYDDNFICIRNEALKVDLRCLQLCSELIYHHHRLHPRSINLNLIEHTQERNELNLFKFNQKRNSADVNFFFPLSSCSRAHCFAFKIHHWLQDCWMIIVMMVVNMKLNFIF